MQINGELMFVHVPKTGGQSVTEALNPVTTYMLDIHDTLFRAMEAEPHDFFSRWRFGFVRNPFDREVSNYFWHCKANDKFDVSFEDFVKWRYDETYNPFKVSDFRDTTTYWYQRGFGKNPQVGFFVTPDGQWLHNFIGRYETLQEDWAVVAKKFNLTEELPHSHKTQREEDYRTYYTDELVDIVTKAHKIDLDVFNYDFDKGMISKEINKDIPIHIHIHHNYNYYYG